MYAVGTSVSERIDKAKKMSRRRTQKNADKTIAYCYLNYEFNEFNWVIELGRRFCRELRRFMKLQNELLQ